MQEYNILDSTLSSTYSNKYIVANIFFSFGENLFTRIPDSYYCDMQRLMQQNNFPFISSNMIFELKFGKTKNIILNNLVFKTVNSDFIVRLFEFGRELNNIHKVRACVDTFMVIFREFINQESNNPQHYIKYKYDATLNIGNHVAKQFKIIDTCIKDDDYIIFKVMKLPDKLTNSGIYTCSVVCIFAIYAYMLIRIFG